MGRPPKIIFVNRYFHPDHSATSQILADLAFDLAARGRRVHVIASRQTYDEPGAMLPRSEEIGGVRIDRVATTRRGRGRLAGRAADYASFYISAAAKAWRIARRGDVIVAKTDPPLLSVPLGRVAALRRATLVNWLQDLYPEIAAALGVGMPAWQTRLLQRARNRSLLRASKNVAIGDDMRARLAAAGVPEETLEIIPNWTDDEAVRPVAPERNPLRKAWGLEGRFVVGYSGNLGRAHEFETVLAAAELLRAEEDIRFLVVGGGHRYGELRQEAAKRGLTGFVFQDYQPRERLAESLSVPDVHWLSLKPVLDGLLLPSKFYGIGAAGRPMIVIGSPGSEFARLVREHRCGEAVAIGDAAGVASAITSLRGDPERRLKMGEAARAMVTRHFSKAEALARWRALLDEVLAQ